MRSRLSSRIPKSKKHAWIVCESFTMLLCHHTVADNVVRAGITPLMDNVLKRKRVPEDEYDDDDSDGDDDRRKHTHVDMSSDDARVEEMIRLASGNAFGSSASTSGLYISLKTF